MEILTSMPTPAPWLALRNAMAFLWRYGRASMPWALLSFPVLGGLIGFQAWHVGSNPWALLWVLFLPVAWGVSTTRLAAIGLIASYYLVSSIGVVAGIANFFGGEASGSMAVGLWVGFCVVATLPFALLWSGDARTRPLRFVMALCVSTLPPVALVGAISPIVVSGLLFPALGWLGLGLTVGTLLALGYRHVKLIQLCIVTALIANGPTLLKTVEAPSNWKAQNTHFDGMANGEAHDAGQLLAAMERIEWLKDFASTVPANSVRVLPETILGPFNGLAQASLAETEATLRARGSIVLVGAELPQPDKQYFNVAIALGAPTNANNTAIQNIPVPIAMWKPWTSEGAKGNPFKRQNSLRIKGMRASVIICYEQLLPYALLGSMLSDPDILVAVSNVRWARGTTVPEIQRRTVESFARLFGIPLVQSTNS